MTVHSAVEILDFWFAPENEKYHFEKSNDFDEQIRSRFYGSWEAACNGELAVWRSTIQGRLAEIIILDQFSRNLMRNDPRAYAQDKIALVLSQEIIMHPNYDLLTQTEQQYALMPFMHSESSIIHRDAYRLFEELGLEDAFKYEQLHKDIIDRFGRYPHRNEILGRESTAEEIAFLKEDDSSSPW